MGQGGWWEKEMMNGLTYPNYDDLTPHHPSRVLVREPSQGKVSKGTLPRKTSLFQENSRQKVIFAFAAYTND